MQFAVVVGHVSPLPDHFPEEVGGLIRFHIGGLVWDCSNSIANTLESLQSCTKPLIYDMI